MIIVVLLLCLQYYAEITKWTCDVFKLPVGTFGSHPPIAQQTSAMDFSSFLFVSRGVWVCCVELYSYTVSDTIMCAGTGTQIDVMVCLFYLGNGDGDGSVVFVG
jgi:hypothetical protein